MRWRRLVWRLYLALLAAGLVVPWVAGGASFKTLLVVAIIMGFSLLVLSFLWGIGWVEGPAYWPWRLPRSRPGRLVSGPKGTWRERL